jgi:hypothetical protein
MPTRAARQEITPGSTIVLNNDADEYPIWSSVEIPLSNGMRFPFVDFQRTIVVINQNSASPLIHVDQSTANSNCNVGGVLRGGSTYRLQYSGHKRNGAWNFIGGLPKNPVIIAAQFRDEDTGPNNIGTTIISQEIVPNPTSISKAGADSITIDQTGTGDIEINTVAGTINIANDAVAQTVSIGNATGASAVSVSSGTGNLALDSTGVLELNSSGGAISIGNDADAQSINIGTGAAARTITIGNSTGGNTAVNNLNVVSRPTRATITTTTNLTASESGYIVPWDLSGAGHEINLPAVVAGMRFTFVHAGDSATADKKIVANGSDRFYGFSIGSTTPVSANAHVDIDMSNNINAGDWVDVEGLSTNVWKVFAHTSASGGVTFS